MKNVGLYLLLSALVLSSFNRTYAQKKFDNALKKIDGFYNLGSYKKASKKLTSFKAKVTKSLGQQNNYMPGYYLRDAKISLALGMLGSFESSIANAATSSLTVFGENSTSYGTTLVQIAEVYNDYGNFRLARENVNKGKDILRKTNQLTPDLDGWVTLVEAEAMIGQGYNYEAFRLLMGKESYFLGRGVEKQTSVDQGAIKTSRVPIEELPLRFGDLAKFQTLAANALRMSGDLNRADSAFSGAQTSIKKNQRFLSETSTIFVENRFLEAEMWAENGRVGKLNFDDILNDLKKKTNPTTLLAHNIYLAYLADLQKNDNRSRFQNVKLEYEKNVNKNFDKNSVHRINLKAIEFETKLDNDKTKNLESDASTILNSKSLPKAYKTTLKILDFLYKVAIVEKRFVTAETYLNQFIDVKKELCGDNSPEYHLARLRLGEFYLDYTNKIDEAGKIFDESYTKVIATATNVRHKDRLEILNHLAGYYELTDRYKEARKTLKDAYEAALVKYDKADPAFAVELNNNAKLLISLGDYETATKYTTDAIKILDDHRKEDEWTRAYVRAIETQAVLNGIKGQFDEAEDNLDDTRKLIKKSRVAVSDELETAKDLSSLFIQLGRYSETEELLEKLINESEQLFGKNSIRLIEPLVNMGRIELARGEYTEAEKIALRANQIAVKTYGDNSTKTAPTQKLLSDIYSTLGDYDKAETNVTKALASQEKQFGRNHIEVAKSLSQLALIKFYKGENRDAVEKLMVEAQHIMGDKLGKDNPQYAEILKNVAIINISQKKYDVAFNALTVAEGIWREKTGTKNNINSAAIYTLTGDVYYQIKNYKKAEDFYNMAKDLYERFFSTTHPEYVKVLSKLSKVYYMQKDFKRSKKMLEESLNNYENYIKLYFPALSEREKAKYWNTIRGDFEFYNTLAFSNLEDFKDLTGKVYNYQLLTKALLLSSSIKIRERIMNSTDEDLKTQYTEWQQNKEKLTLALSMSPQQLQENEIDPIALQQEVERLEKDISQRSELFGQSFESKRVTFDDVRKALKPNEVAIEMVRYRYFNHTFTDSVIYAALYVKNELSKPKAIILGDGTKMETRYFKYYRNAITGKVQDEISYRVFWEPIYNEIGAASTLYLSAEGIYNQINLEAIPSPEGKYIIDNSNIVLVSNTRDIYWRKIKTRVTSSTNSASMFGNPTFYLASTGGMVAPLPGTEKEVSQLDFMLKQKGWNTTEYVEKSATEEKVKELNSPKIFHIATHGFYKPTEAITEETELEGNEAALAQNPLLRTGLLLKGAGDLLDKTSYNYNMDNGILTAYEAMSLNLDKTDLVVLSACETGLGELQAGEGVQGLQRAFLVAGAKVLIMSMFKVDDEATQKLMLKFYQKWLNTGNLRQSFIDAKIELRSDYPEPIYWGAFMMIGLE